MTIDELSQWERVLGGLPPLDESTDEGKKKKRTSITMLTEQLAQPVAAGTDDG